ncbi:MAG TPA: MFS transporter [Stellaceae bacterium]|nr:MFS transporter [Stellaceae bacterium]
MRNGWPLIGALALAQLVSWGAIYYGFTLFVVPMEAELHWGRTAINGALSLGLLISGFAAFPIGSWIDRRGGRLVMSLGSALGAVLLVAWSFVENIAVFYAIWIGLGVAMAATLYDPVFVVLTRSFPRDYRLRITSLTLIGGFASTVFIPLTQLFIGWFGWRHALIALALCNLLIALPVHALCLRDRERPASDDPPAPGESSTREDASLARAFHHPVFWCLAFCFTAYYATFSAMTFHLVPLLTERGASTGIIVSAYAAIGPAQVAGRIALLLIPGGFSTAIAGRIALLALPLSMLCLILFPTSTVALFVFAALYGAGNGVLTIVRGTAVPDLMWREGYGAINGALALPANVAKAAAPFGAALIWSLSGGYEAVLWSIFVGSLLAALAWWCAALRPQRFFFLRA